MNSEELEQSLRTEFENYLKDVVADLRQGVSDFQDKITADFDKHKEQLEGSLQELNQKVGSDKELEVSFTESVAEHLKLARDEGASITAKAIAEAEKLEVPVDEGPDFFNLSRAIDDISGKDSQSEILKALVNHAAEFTPRGAFFIVKNEHLVGWRVFGREEHEDPKVVREVFFPVASNTALSSSVKELSTISEAPADGEDDVMYRNKLGFENPERMHAVPLIARGRGVAVLYADNGTEGHTVNIAAIEVLMRVAGLTVEVLASAPPVARAKPEAEEADSAMDAPEAESVEDEVPSTEFGDAEFSPEEPAEVGFADEFQPDAVAVEDAVEEAEESDNYEFQPVTPVAEFDSPIEPEEPAIEPAEEVAETSEFESAESFEAPQAEFEAPVSEYNESSFDAGSVEEVEVAEEVESPSWEAPMSEESDQAFSPNETYSADESFTPDESFSSDIPAHDTGEFEAAEAGEFEVAEESPAAFEAFDPSIEEPYIEPVADEQAEAYEFESDDGGTAFESPVEEAPSGTDFQFEQPVEAPAVEEPVAEEVVTEVAPAEEAAAPPVRSRFADRNLDLPIEVGEDERRLHNDARRFARLLVSEIKLYNEQKVKEGRESSDLYERLREAIDRSREMYDKRVQPPVAAKFDYFNYELVNTLAEGDEGKLGGSYPGAAV